MRVMTNHNVNTPSAVISMDAVLNLFNTVQKGILDGDQNIIAIFVAVVIVFLTLVIFAVRSGTNKRSGVLILGLCDAGKTLIFSRLVYGGYKHTHTSIRENHGNYCTKTEKKRGSLQLYDLPGYERLRYQALDRFKSQARGIMFVVDSSTFQRDLKDVAEFLYNVMTDPDVARSRPPILIVCNKSDQALAKGCWVIQTALEKEMNTLRVTRSAALRGTDNASINNAYLGRRGKDFSFQDLKPFKVEFTECSARGNKDEKECELSGLEEWIDKLL